MRVRVGIYLGAEEHKLGPGKIALLEAIGRTGSISAAAREFGMAYRHAWNLVDELNHCFEAPVVEAATGGKRGGGASLTPWGRDLVLRFRRIEESAQRAIARELEVLTRSLAPRKRPAKRRASA